MFQTKITLIIDLNLKIAVVLLNIVQKGQKYWFSKFHKKQQLSVKDQKTKEKSFPLKADTEANYLTTKQSPWIS